MTAKPSQPIATNHRDYAFGHMKWRRCRDAVAGTDRIKEAGVEYLPALSAHKTDQDGRLGSGMSRYDAYLKRALFYNMAGFTVIGLSGIATMRPPKITTSGPKAAEFAKTAARFRHQLIGEQIEVARAVMVVNQIGTDDPFPSFFWAESIVNWAFTYKGGVYELSMLVIEDDEEKPGPTPFVSVSALVRHAYVMTDGVCHYSKWTLRTSPEDSDVWLERTEGFQPLSSAGGKPLDHIPAIVVGATAVNEPDVEKPVILDLVDVNISHYQNSADLEHGRHWTALPTAVASGFPTRDNAGNAIVLNVGGESAWVTEQTGASAHYLEFSGAGLGHLQAGMETKQAMAAVLGARLLEESKAGVESADTIKTRHAGERSVLSRVTVTCSNALTWTLREMLRFATLGYETAEGKDTIELNADYLNKKLSPQELTALTATLQAGGISYQSYFALLQGAEIIPEARTIEEETELIEAGNPGPPSANPFVPKDEGADEDEEMSEDMMDEGEVSA